MPFFLRKEDIDSLLTGFGVLGTGGGGDPEWGRQILLSDIAHGRKYEIVSPDEVPDDAVVCSGGIMGSIKQFGKLSYAEIVRLWEDDFLLTRAIRIMERVLGKKVDYIMPFEVGGLNTPVIFTAAARLGIPVIDADFVGRAAPETHMTTCIGLGVDLYPMPIVDSYGNETVIIKGSTPVYADEIGRIIVEKGGNYAANAHYPMSGKEMKRICIPGTVSHSIEVGNVILASKDANSAARAFVELEKGIHLFQGRTVAMEEEEKVGFYVTTCALEGMGDYAGQQAKLVIKNETMALWVDEKLKAVFPDFVCMLDSNTGKGILSNTIVLGTEMMLVGIMAHENLRACMKTQTGQLSLGGGRYGYPELEYVPLERLNA